MLQIADILNTIIQSLMLILIPNFCTQYKYENNKSKLIFIIVSFFAIVTGITHIIGNTSLGVIIIHGIMILMGIILFKKDTVGATIAMSIVYLAIFINMLIMSNIFIRFIQHQIPEEYFNIGFICSVYMPQYIMGIFILLRKDLIHKIYLFVRSKRISIYMILIITIIADFIMSFNFIINDIDNPLFKPMIYLIGCIFALGITIYFASVEKNSKEIALLNKQLEEKLDELKKVKHDYGAQISYLYGMHLMGKYDRLGGALKEIINGYNDITSEIKVINSESLISTVVNTLEHKGIKILVSEDAELREISIKEMELQRIISNILRNSITAMNGKGTIKISTYYNFNTVNIKIENDGPQIPYDIIDKIFDVGFTTKENIVGENGYGLAIVKEILEKHNGKIEVSSTKSSTYFMIKIPICTEVKVTK